MKDVMILEKANHNILEIRDNDANELLRITPDGRIFWKRREVETDDDFRAAIFEIRDALTYKQ
jgi:hypothetical protein